MQTKRSARRKKYSTAKRTLHYFWAVTKTQPWIFLLGLISTIGYVVLLTYANSYYFGKIVDRVTEGGVTAENVFTVFGPYIAALIIVNAVGQFCSKLQDYACWKAEINANYDLATNCFDTLSNQSMTFHSDRFGGSLVSQTTKFMNAYTQLMELWIYSILPLIVSVIMIIVMLIKPVPLYVGILFVMLVIYTLVAYLMYKKILPLNAQAAASQNDLSGELSDAVTNILAVKTYGKEDYERGLFHNANLRVVRSDSKRMRASTLVGSISAAIIVVIMIAVTIFIAGGNAWFGISAGTLIMMFTYTYQLTMRFNMINSTMQRLNRAFGDAADMTQILDEPTLVADLPDANPLTVTKGDISIEHLEFRYDDATAAKTDSAESDVRKTQDVFCDFNLHIPAGQRIGLVGRSGTGKTTLTKLLLRLSDIQEGSICIDGQNISHCTQQSLRRQVAYVPQEALLFHRSIRENIAYGRPDATEEEIRTAAAQANALEFIEKLPQGFDTLVGERGIKLSGGQRQRVAIARAILADAPILILDEATSALDSESEKLVQDALVNLMRGRTSLVVAHRLSTVASLDRIIVLADGGISEDGTHQELIEKGGEYAHLWDRQTGAFLEGA
ncbi:MAG: ABC transporter ATP-binding protein [Lachnospiraceae bacterium]|nr:ABC transporter ATP-binding protein [Lachnospiraceae bacterium]